MLKIEHDRENTIEIDHDATGISVQVTDYAGTWDNPFQMARIYLSNNEAKQIRDYLNAAYPPTK